MSDNVRIGNANGTYNITAGDDSVITVGNGNDSINVSGGSEALIRIGNGNVTLIATGGTGNNIRIGNGNDSVTLSGGSGNTIKVGNGNDSVTSTTEPDDKIAVGNGNDMVIAGANSTIRAKNGNDTVTGGDGDRITAGNGNDTVSAGANSRITLGNGNDIVIAGANSTIRTGNGNDTVAAGDGNRITAGGGNDIVSAGANNKIALGNGTDSVSVGAGNTIILGNGNDTVNVTAYLQTDLVSDIAGLATITDPELQNPFGISHSSTSPFWVSNNVTNTATLYAVTGSTTVTKVNINPPSGFVAIPTTAMGTASGNQGPTGQVSNTNTSSFLVGNGGDGESAHFIFANDNGTISAWDTGTTAFIQATTAGADYSGLAINQAQTQLYAANNAGTGSIDVFNSSFAPVSLGAGAFATPTAISALGLNPFNVRDINGSVYVTYALPGNPQNTASLGEGAVAVFDESGTLKQTMVGGVLSSPWGIALAPTGFGQFGGDLLVGNESSLSSEINAFNPGTGAFEGTIPINVGSGNTPGALWALDFGIGGSNGSPNTLYFTDGINVQADGLFGAISVAPAITAGEQITAGNGTDTFNFLPASIGNNTINNFSTKDTIVFNHALFANFAAVFGATTQVGPDTVIKADANDSVTLTNTIASTLSSNNFHFS
jgi:uncharacterized protein (TIGR03118 family)